MRIFSANDFDQVSLDISLGTISNLATPQSYGSLSAPASDGFSTAVTTQSSIVFTIAGSWRPVTSPAVLSSNYIGTLANTFHGLVRLSADGQYGLAVTGWGYSGWPASLKVPAPVSVALLAPDGSGGLKIATSDFISDPATNGGGSVIVADFNGDKIDDIVFIAHNESPFVSAASTAYISLLNSSYNKIVMNDLVLAHDAKLSYIDGKPFIFTSSFHTDPVLGKIAGALINPVYSYDGGFKISLPNFISKSENIVIGMSSVIVQNVPKYGMILASTDRTSDFHIDIFKYQNGDITSTTPVQSITPYLSTLTEYRDFPSDWGKGITHTYRVWSIDLNKDGRGDILAGQSMWSQAQKDWPSALQVLLCDSAGLFQDKTAVLNPDMKFNTNEMDYNPQFIDIDHSGIETLLFSGSTSYGSLARQSDYVLLNDGTGRLYVALHDEFFDLAKEVFNFLKWNFDAKSTPPRFIAVPQSDGSINFVAEHMTWLPNLDKSIKIDNVAGYTYVNVPLRYNPTYDYIKDISITDRNGSMLMRTWAGNDTFYDVNSGSDAHIDGGAGANISVYSGRQDQYQITRLSDGTVVVASLSGTAVPVVHDTLKNIQTLKFANAQVDLLTGGTGASSINGTEGSDSLTGTAASEQIVGGGGYDSISAGAGNDTVDGGSGQSYLRGDDGNDSLIGGAAFDDINGNQGNDTANGNAGEDWVVGGKDNDSLSGGADYDLVYGNLGNDTCNGDDGNDIVRGGQGNDIVNGGAGNDYVSGDKGDDTMTGGAGADIFHSFGDAGIDRVTDFSLAQGDRVQLDPGTIYTVSQSGADTLINMTGGGQMTLVGIQLSSLTGNWIFGA